MDDQAERKETVWVVSVLVVLLVVLLVVILTWSSKAQAEKFSEISAVNASYCALYARQMVFIDAMHGDGKLTADSDVIKNAALAHYVDCISILPTLLPLPSDLGGYDRWVVDIRDLVFLRAKEKVVTIGTVPATAKPTDEEWRRQCRAEYASWNEEDGTVIRRGNPTPVRCPCMAEVQCVY